MSRTLIVRDRFRDDAARFTSDYEQKSAGVGLRFAGAVERILDNIQYMPFMYGKWRPQIRVAQIRKFPFGVFYTV